MASRRHEAPRDISQPEVGYFRIRMIRRGPFVAARIYKRLGFWAAEINGVPCGASDPNPERADGVFRIHETGVRIDKAEYDALLRSPPSSPRLPIDISTMKPEF